MPILTFVYPIEQHRNVVRSGRILVLRVESDVRDMILAGAAIPTREGIGGQAIGAHLQGMAPPSLFQRKPPVGRYVRNLRLPIHIISRYPKTELGIFSKRSVATCLDIKKIEKPRIGTEAKNLLGYRAG